jgi:hypothetical protein
MSYAQFGLIEATDFNTLVGGNPVTSSGKLNTVWATGGTTAGYGQTAVANVASGNTVTATQWSSVVNSTANSASHQGTSITSVSAPVAGGQITYLSAIPTNLTTIYTSRLNAATQGSTTAYGNATTVTWSSIATWTHTVTFSSGDAARYFFNAGGQLKISCTHGNTTAGINLLLNNLCSNVGTVALSSPTSGTVTISSVSYNGVTRVGGGGNAPTISTNSGYYALGVANTTLFTQTASTGPSGYLGTNISMVAKTNGTQGSNGDVGSVITIYTIWDEIPNGLTVGTGSNTIVTVVPPENVYLPTASWGTPTVTATYTAT